MQKGPRFMGKLFISVLTVVLLGAPVAIMPAKAARIAATVNNKAISARDLDGRIKLAIISSGLTNDSKTRQQLREQVLNMMINEQIQLQLGEEYKINIDEATLMASVRDIETQNNMSDGGLKKMLAKNDISFSLMKKHLEASVIWREYVRERYRHLVQVSDRDVERALQELKSNNNETRYHLAEIALYFDDKQPSTRVKGQADRIVHQLKQGAQFSMLAGQFSNAPSSARGGDIGWIPESKLDRKVVAQLKKLEPGQVSMPLQTGKGFRIYLVRDKLAPGQFAKPTTMVSFKQVFVANPKDAFAFEIEDNIKQVVTMARQITSCRVVEKLTARKKAKVQHVKGVPLNNLPPELRKLLMETKENRATKPLYTGNGAMFFVICEKKTTNPKEPSEEEMRAQLVDRKLQNVSEQELRTRRGGAHIDIRS